MNFKNNVILNRNEITQVEYGSFRNVKCDDRVNFLCEFLAALSEKDSNDLNSFLGYKVCY